jgi:peptidyl-prolyl cis-trans isomerase SurA
MKSLLAILFFSFFTLLAIKPVEPHVNSAIKKDAKKLAEFYRQRVLRGESMASIAKLYSEDPSSAANGGQFDNIKKGVMVPEFEKVAFSLKPGEISEVFETQFGFHFIQLISRKGDTLSLRHVLITRD